MKYLTLIRHAKSSWDFPQLRDFDRPLNKRGERDAPEMGKRLSRAGLRPELIVSSPARRALDTAQVIAEALHYPQDAVHEDPRIYEAGIRDLFEVVAELPTECREAMLFGHNPGLTDFTNTLTGEDIENIPTCGVVRCELDVDQWSEAGARCARLVSFDYPKKIPSSLDP